MKNERCLIKKFNLFSKKIVEICLIFISLTFTMGFYSDNNIYTDDLKEITVELGETIPYDKLSYATSFLSSDSYSIEDNVIHDEYGATTKIGTYNYYIVYLDNEMMFSKRTNHEGIINVIDTIEPQIVLKKDKFTFSYNSKISVYDIATCVDNSNCTLEFEKKVNSKKEGNQTLTIIATDEANNQTKIDVKIKIKSKPKRYSGGNFDTLNVKNNALNSKLTNNEKDMLRHQIIEYAKRFVGNPYVYGGSSLTKGTDCSGFTKAIYEHFGYSLPRVAVDQSYVGKRISYSELMPGDIIVYRYSNGGGHVGIYIGNNKMIHAGTEKTGIVIAKIFAGDRVYQRIIY